MNLKKIISVFKLNDFFMSSYIISSSQNPWNKILRYGNRAVAIGLTLGSLRGVLLKERALRKYFSWGKLLLA
jgi:hypothetical protein